MIGERQLRAFCRLPMGTPVSFAGVSRYADDGSLICGLLDRPAKYALEEGGIGGVSAEQRELRLPCNAFATMPTDGDTITLTDCGKQTDYTVNAPTADDDGGFLCYQLLDTESVDVQAAAAPQSIYFQVTAAIAAALGGEAANAYRCRFSAFTQDDLKNGGTDNVIPKDEDAAENTTDDTELTGQVYVRHLAASVDGADAVVDARYVRGARLILADHTLGGVVRRIKLTGRKWEFEVASMQLIACVATYEFEYSTTRTDPGVAGY